MSVEFRTNTRYEVSVAFPVKAKLHCAECGHETVGEVEIRLNNMISSSENFASGMLLGLYTTDIPCPSCKERDPDGDWHLQIVPLSKDAVLDITAYQDKNQHYPWPRGMLS